MMRAIWKGNLSFGLINIPINLYSGSKERELSFHLFHAKDLSPIEYARICTKEKKEVSWEEIVKGYPLKNGKVVILEEEDFKRANLRKTRTLDIIDFTNQEEIDPIFYEKPYFLEPQKGAEKAYILLNEALAKTGKVGVANFVLRNHEHIGIIRPYKHFLLMNQLRYLSEIEAPELNVPKKIKIFPKELEMAVQLIENLAGHFKPENYRDAYTEELMHVILEKAKGKKPKLKDIFPKHPKKISFVSALEESLKIQRHKRKKKAA